MKFEHVHDNRSVMLLQCISGSRAYGLDTPKSDTDIRGVFLLPKREYYGFEYTPQVGNPSNDIVYYELKRYMELLVKNNPNILELLNTPPDAMLYKHPVIELIKPDMFLSKLCLQTFAGYALTQVKKAGGLNKKIFNPVDKERKSILDFSYYLSGYQAVPLQQWLDEQGYKQEECGLVRIPHARDMYAVFHNSQLTSGYLEGICSGLHANDIKLSSVPERLVPLGIITFNKDGYSMHCRDHKEYWEWVEKRNDLRYSDTLEHGKNYDAKNMMHTFRLLNMASEIATERKVNVRRSDRDFLFKVRNGVYTYDNLLRMVDEKTEQIKEQYAVSDLPDMPDEAVAQELLVRMREELYNNQ